MKENELITFKEGEKQIEYTLVEKIGEGSVGEVWRVKDNEGKTHALKFHKQGNEQQFKENALELYQKPSRYFAKVEKVGTIEMSNDSGDTVEKQALVMEDGGSDLYAVCSILDPNTVSTNALEAFKYKVLLTVIDGLTEFHAKKRAHGDLLPANILTGLNLKEILESSPQSLEEKLIHEPVLLCDPVGTRTLGTVQVSNPSLFGEKWRLTSTFLCRTSDDPKIKDTYATLALYSWLKGFSKKEELAQVITDELKLTLGKDSDGRTTYPPLEQIRQKIAEEIRLSDYFMIEEKTAFSGNKYPVVYRPVDAFEAYSKEWEENWKQRNELTETDLTNFISQGKYSYASMSVKGGTKVKADEKTRMLDIFEGVLKRSAIYLNEKITQKSTKWIPLNEEYQKLNTEKQELEQKSMGLEQELAELSKAPKAQKERSSQKRVAELNRDCSAVKLQVYELEDQMEMLEQNMKSPTCNCDSEREALVKIREAYSQYLSARTGSENQAIKQIFEAKNI